MIRAFVAATFMLGAVPAQASTLELMGALTRTLNFSGSTMTADQRRAFALAGVDYWKSFDSRIPRNSPADQAWLDGEMAVTDMERLGRMSMSPQYSIRELVQMSESCIQSHEMLGEHVGGDRATELYLWIKASWCYTRSDTVHQLQRAGLSNGKYDGSFDMGTFGIIANNISEEIANSAHQGL